MMGGDAGEDVGHASDSAMTMGEMRSRCLGSAHEGCRAATPVPVVPAPFMSAGAGLTGPDRCGGP